MNEIAPASQEQRAGIEAINVSVGKMDEMTQADKVMVDEVSTAARSMEEEAIKLSELVNTFKLASDSTQRHSIAIVGNDDECLPRLSASEPSRQTLRRLT